MGEFFKDLLGFVKFDAFPSNPQPGDITNSVLNWAQNIFLLLFVIVIIVAIIYSVLAGLRYITSQGQEEKVQKAGNALKAVFMGLLFVFLGIIAVVFITNIFTNFESAGVRRALCGFLEPGSETKIEQCVKNSAK